jgi:hypothetical protein
MDVCQTDGCGLVAMTSHVLLLSLYGLEAKDLCALNGTCSLFNRVNSIWSLSITEEAARVGNMILTYAHLHILLNVIHVMR